MANVLINSESGTEMARLFNQHRLVTGYMGGLFPQEVDTSKIQNVLDLACGPGSWVQDVAFAYQDMEIIGVDTSQAMVKHAQALASVQWLTNASFECVDIRQPLNFSDASFDFIQARFLATLLTPGEWPGLLAECRRLLRPGGIICLVEADWPDTNSPAVQQLGRIVIQALARLGRDYGTNGQHLGTLSALVPWLRDAGLTRVRSRVYEISLAPPGPVYMHPIMELMRTMLWLMEPSLLQLEVTTQKEFTTLLSAMEVEANNYNFDFQGVQGIAESWGEVSNAGE